MRFALTTCLALLTSGAAFASCPVPEDMTTGVRFFTTDGATEVHKQTRPGWVQILATFPGGDAYLMEFYGGMYMLSSVPVEGGVPQLAELEPYASIGTIQQWPAAAPNTVWQNTAPDGGTAQSGPLTQIVFGACSYETFDVTVRFADDPAYSETYRYFTELKTSLLISSDDGQLKEVYIYSGISKVAP